MKQMSRSVRPLLALACLTLALGCSGGKKLNLAPVSGTVTVGGQPLTAGQVSFLPATKDQEGTLSAGTIGSDGKYTIFTGGKSGAPLGKYKVTVTPSMMPSADGKAPTFAFNQKYRDAKTTTLLFEVVEKPDAGRYDLKLDK